MNLVHRLLLRGIILSVILHSNPAALWAGVSFTRVTGDPVVSDSGLSRGIVFVDYDGDRYPDVYVANSAGGAENNRLYHNNGDGTFARVLGSPLVSFAQNTDCTVWGDYDNDGDLDVYMSTWSNQLNRMYQNDSGVSFTQITSGDPVTATTYSDYASWVDYDRDGWLDLFVGFGFSVMQNKLYHSNGDGTFSITTSGEILTDAFRTHGCAWGDYDNDGEIDLFVANSSGQNNNLYRNLGNGNFERILIGDIVNDGGFSLRSNWGDIDNDLDLDLFVSNGQNEANFLYRNNGDGSFSRVFTGDPVTEALPSQSVAFADFDNDGDNDLFVANGFGPSTLTNSLFWNDGTGAFTKDTIDVVATETGSGHGVSVDDCDRDGDLDIVLGKGFNNIEDNALFLNNGNSNHWVSIRCVGVISNRSAIGARVRSWATINSNTVAQLRDISSPASYGNTGLTAWFGLGNATQIDSLIVDWPSGQSDSVFGISAGGFYTIVEGLGLACSESDIDNDGYPDVAGSCPADNCPDRFNPDQTDSDGDGAGDACDLCPADQDDDIDGDMICAPDDNCVNTANSGQEDTDSDGIGDACCCVGMRGNVNGDPEDNIDVSDLTYLTGFMFKGGAEPPCPNEADIGGDMSTDIADLTALVSFMFKGGSNPTLCP